jgi:hypothetical protein
MMPVVCVVLQTASLYRTTSTPSVEAGSLRVFGNAVWEGQGDNCVLIEGGEWRKVNLRWLEKEVENNK